MFNKYYQDELTYLRDLGREFAREYPALAPLLGQAGSDPDVERLLEGVAFLTGRVRQKLDDELPEIVHSVASLLFPHLLRPVPAASILEFLPARQALRDRRVIPAGAEFDSIPVDGTPCRFRTSVDCEVIPWTLEGVRLVAVQATRYRLSFTLRLSPGMTLGQLRPERVRLHIAEERRLSLSLLSVVLESTQQIELSVEKMGGGRDSIHLPKSAIRPVGFGDEEALLPLTDHVLPGFRLVEEYFILPEKFAFFELEGLEQAAERFPKATALEVAIELEASLPWAQNVPADILRLHCVPIVNVFRTTAEPIRVVPERERFLVRAAGLPANRGGVYAILDVVGVDRATDRRVKVRPFFDYSHAFDPDNPICYATHLQSSVIGHDVDWMLTIDRPGTGDAPVVDVLSLEILATNGRLGGQVRAQDVTVPTPTSPPFAQFRNIVQPTPYVPAPLGDDLHWRVIAHLATGLRTLLDADVLRAALRVYNLHGLVDRQAARAAELRIDAIRQMKVKPAERLYRGSLVRGIDVQLELDEGGFAGEGDMFLFGAVLDRLFASYVPINSFAQTLVKGLNSRTEHAFPARSGNLEIL